MFPCSALVIPKLTLAPWWPFCSATMPLLSLHKPFMSTAGPGVSADTIDGLSPVKGGLMVAHAESLRDRQRAQSRRDIRRAAFRLFAERGYDSGTTEEIAAAAGIAPRTFFRHRPPKEESV